MIIGDLLDAGCVASRASAADKRQALSIVAELAARAFHLKAPKIFDVLMEREALGPTGVGHGVAIPHGQVAGLEQIRGVFVRLDRAVDFGAVDDEPVDLLFAILAPKGQGSEHLRALARVSRVLRQPKLREQLRAARGADAIQALLTQDTRSNAA